MMTFRDFINESLNEAAGNISVSNVKEAISALKSNGITVTSHKYTSGEEGTVNVPDTKEARAILKGLGLYKVASRAKASSKVPASAKKWNGDFDELEEGYTIYGYYATDKPSKVIDTTIKHWALKRKGPYVILGTNRDYYLAEEGSEYPYPDRQTFIVTHYSK